MPLALAEAHAGYRPRAAQNALKDIVGDSIEDLLRRWDERSLGEYGPLHSRLRKLFESFLRCGDLHFGFLRLRCECGYEWPSAESETRP